MRQTTIPNCEPVKIRTVEKHLKSKPERFLEPEVITTSVHSRGSHRFSGLALTGCRENATLGSRRG